MWSGENWLSNQIRELPGSLAIANSPGTALSSHYVRRSSSGCGSEIARGLFDLPKLHT